MIKDICRQIDEKKEELFELLGSFIKINSENFSSHGNEEELARFIYKICLDLGLESEIYSPLDVENFKNHPDYVDGHNLENRYNVTARWHGKENVDELTLMAHTDTVEIGNLSGWDFDPLSGEVRDGKILGRGACDDKYALAAALFVIKLLKENGFTPKKNIIFSAYSDEEYGGSHGALAAVLKYPTDRIVSLDCVDGVIWHCGSGGQVVTYNFHTKETVDSAGKAGYALNTVMQVLEKFKENRFNELSANPYYKGTEIPSQSLRYMEVRAGDNGLELGKGKVNFVFYTDKSKEEIYKEFSEIEKELQKKLEPLGIIGDGFEENTRFFHYVYTEPDSEDIKCMLEASREAANKELKVVGSCLSDLSVISKYGSNKAYGFGIGRDFSEIGGAHQPNEFVECDKLLEYTKTIAAYILKSC